MRYLKFYIILFLAIGLLACKSSAQSIDKITRKCPNGNLYSTVLVQANGDIVSAPCASRKFQFTGVVDFTGALVVGLPPSPPPVIPLGDGTIPMVMSGALVTSGYYFNSASDYYGWDGGFPASDFKMGLNISDQFGMLQIGDLINGNPNRLEFSGGLFEVSVNNGSGTTGHLLNEHNLAHWTISNGVQDTELVMMPPTVELGNVSGTGSKTRISLNSATRFISLNAAGSQTPDTVGSVIELRANRIAIPNGTNQPRGGVFIPSGSSTFTVNNTSVQSTSMVIPILGLDASNSPDATCTYIRATTLTAGSFTIYLNAACTSDVYLRYLIIN